MPTIPCATDSPQKKTLIVGMRMPLSNSRLVVFVSGVFFLSACVSAPQFPEASSLVVPEPREDAEGAYLSPYTSDDVIARWVEKGMNAKVGAQLGSMAGQKAMENVPLIGGFVGDAAGKEIGREAAIQLVGGMEYMRSTTDLSFDNVDDAVIYTYARHFEHPDYQKVIDLVGSIYPEYQERYSEIILNAPKLIED